MEIQIKIQKNEKNKEKKRRYKGKMEKNIK